MKIAQFIDSTDPGGAETLVIELSKRLPELGYRVEVLHFGNVWLERECAVFGIPCEVAPAHDLYRSIKTLPLFAFRFHRFLKQRGIGLLHSHLFGSITGAMMAAALGGVRHVGTLHDTYSIEASPSRFMLLQISSFLGTRLVVVSEHMRQYFYGLSGRYQPVFKKIANGVDVGLFHKSRNIDFRNGLELNQEDIVFITIGRLVEIKRHDLLIRAFSLLKRRPISKLLIVGDGPCRPYLESLIAEYSLKDRITILGFRSDVADLLSISDCFVLSSDSEGLSYSVIESMAAGLPAVLTDVGGNNELVEHGYSGYIVPRNNAHALAHYMQKITQDEKNRNILLGENAYRRAREGFSIERTVQQYADLYTELLA
jgi:glycosyltransferase involved in cell wall biosynthesis